eukprot:COSAG06_NODE_31032_length_528_cov_0.648019_1_plen_72_part_10
MNRRQATRAYKRLAALSWGRHYVWPVSTLPYELQIARQAYTRHIQLKKMKKRVGGEATVVLLKAVITAFKA